MEAIPPLPAVPTGYFLRLNDQDGYKQRLLTFFESLDYTRVVCLRHDGDREDPHSHYHAVIETKVKKQAMRVRLKTAFPEGKGNGHLSLKDWDGSIDAVAYMFHEDVEHLVCSKGCEENYLSKARARCTAVKAAVVEAKERASHHLIDMCYESFHDSEYPNDLEIAIRVLELAFRNDKHIPTKFQMLNYIQRIQWKLCRGDDISQTRLIHDIAAHYLA